MYEWRVRATAAPSDAVLEEQLNGFEREGFEIFQVQWTGGGEGRSMTYVIARRVVARRNTDVAALLADQANAARKHHDSGSR